MKVLQLILAICFITIVSTRLFSQGWIGKYGDIGPDAGHEITQTTDGGFIIANCGSLDVLFGNKRASLIRTDEKGHEIWCRYYFDREADCKDVVQTSDGGFVAVANYFDNSNFTDTTLVVFKVDPNGDLLWKREYEPSEEQHGDAILKTSDGGFLIGGYTDLIDQNHEEDMYALKVDSLGIFEWESNYGGASGDRIYDICEAQDGGYVLAGSTFSYGAGANDILIVKISSTGIQEWYSYFGGDGHDIANSIEKTMDGNYIIGGNTQSFNDDWSDDIYAVKIDISGSLIWERALGSTGYESSGFGTETKDGNYVFSACTDSTTFYQAIFLTKLDQDGNQVWERIHNVSDYEQAFALCKTTDYGCAITGLTLTSDNIDDADQVIILKTDSLGNIFTNEIRGRVFYDENQNCNISTGELSLANWLVIAEPGPHFDYTDANGNYTVKVDSGAYIVKVIPPADIWLHSCDNSSYEIYFDGFYQFNSVNNFPMIASSICPMLQVEVSTIGHRSCFQTYHDVLVRNIGPQTATDAYIEVHLDEFIIPISSTLPWSDETDNLLTFNVGTLEPMQEISFRITDSISCDAEMEQTLCVAAHAFPDSTCEETSQEWDKSSIEVFGWCSDELQACFLIRNNGEAVEGDMITPRQIRVYADNVLIDTMSFLLAGNESMEFCYNTEGNTIRLEADQHPEHPGNSHPQASVELCGSAGTMSVGQINTVPLDDQDYFIDIECQPVTSSFDPNDKSVYPTGISEFNWIDSTTTLTYMIRFQNTGNDTALNVRIMDTISEYLDLSSFISGQSSHPYEYTIYSGNVVEWYFEDIMLPDSNINGPGSHGYVKFKISQQPNNPNGTLIENTANIYFDYNDPVITNTVFNIVYDTVLIDLIDKTSEPEFIDQGFTLNCYPNPADDYVNINIQLDGSKTCNIIIVNSAGEVIEVIKNSYSIKEGNSTLQVDLSSYSKGIYYVVYSDNKRIGAVKFVRM
jgi:hypothetical protein